MPENISLFTELSVLIAIAAVISLIMRLLKQPLIIGYILTGLLAGPFAFDLIKSADTLKLFSEIGIAFLLFTVGLNLSPKVLKDYGKIALITGIGQVTFTTVIGFFVCQALGFNTITSLYLSIGLAFSSTIIILKLISDKGDMEELYAKISVGFLLVQDLIAILLLLAIPIFSGGGGSAFEIGKEFGLMALIAAIAFGVAFTIFPRMNSQIARSSEFLFLFSIAWGIGIAALFRHFGFSIESGALIAGIALSTLPSRHEINARLIPLRDFFLILFFVLLGAHMTLTNVTSQITPAIILSLLVLIGNPLIILAIMGVLGYRKKTSLQTGFTVAQISEFSLVLIALGVKLGQIEESVLSLATMIALVTIFGSTYFMLYSDSIYKRLAPALKIFERKHARETYPKIDEYAILLFGGNRIGFDFIELFRKEKDRFAIIDHDPEIVKTLESEGFQAMYGDAGDADLLEELKVAKAELIISTIPDVETNLLILEEARKDNGATPVIAVSHNITNALELYKAGATYVVLPHFLGGNYAASLAREFAKDLSGMGRIREEHIAYLEERSRRGHEHPALARLL